MLTTLISGCSRASSVQASEPSSSIRSPSIKSRLSPRAISMPSLTANILPAISQFITRFVIRSDLNSGLLNTSLATSSLIPLQQLAITIISQGLFNNNISLRTDFSVAGRHSASFFVTGIKMLNAGLLIMNPFNL